MRDILIYNGKNMDLADWLLQIKNVAIQPSSQEYELATAKSTRALSKMLKRMGKTLNQNEKKCIPQ